MTESERIVLAYLDDKMEATRQMIGEALAKTRGDPAWRIAPENSASAILGKLRKEGLVSRAPELRAWQITTAGRDVLRVAAR